MPYTLEITERDYDSNNYVDGDRGPAVNERDESRTFGDAYDTDDVWGDPLTPVQWAINTLRPMAEFEPSSYPLQDQEPERTWISAWCARDFTSSIETEVTVYLTGEWTDSQRAEVFRGVTEREAPAGYPW